MSVVQNTLIGRARQKIGGSVFSTWKGHNVLKSKPLTVANPKTPGQVQQRSALSQITAIFRAISGAINLGFKQQAVGMSEFNAFASYNLKNAIDKSVPGVATLIHTDLLVSQGTITATPIDSATADVSDGNTTVNWLHASLQPGQSNNDQARVVLFNASTGVWFVYTGAAIRSDGTVVIPRATFTFTPGTFIYCYLFFYNTSNRKSSDSVETDITATA